uniref:Uncharacterized protein n=1 Tax=Branchiostoma floridae TaxID=7739 RepID=C3Y398_BRAFL|eukprot:XP_002609155.1 hypothetical protein BRAFLDRAFT_106288 [Branchiostoma floridae]
MESVGQESLSHITINEKWQGHENRYHLHLRNLSQDVLQASCKVDELQALSYRLALLADDSTNVTEMTNKGTTAVFFTFAEWQGNFARRGWRGKMFWGFHVKGQRCELDCGTDLCSDQEMVSHSAGISERRGDLEHDRDSAE